jgi:hypothetical protein
VPWLKLLPCDTVNIHYSPTPYKELILISNRGAAGKFIRITGVPGPNGELPIIDGSGAVIAAPGLPVINPSIEGAGLFSISVPKGYTYGYKPGYIEISNLEFRNANPHNTYKKGDGTTATWGVFSSAIYIERAEYVTISNCHFHDNGLGVFQNSKFGEAAQSRGLLVDRNYFHDNGTVGSAHEHHAYTEGIGTTYQFNFFGPIVSGSYGQEIKDRSAGSTVRYNHFEGQNYQIYLPDPESNYDYEKTAKDAWGQPLMNSAYIYGNEFVLKDLPGYGQSQPTVLGFGEAYAFPGGPARGGTIYFYNNTVVSKFDYEYWHHRSLVLFTLADLTNQPQVSARNNVFYATSATPGKAPEPFALFYHYGKADFTNNWISSGWLLVDPWQHDPSNPQHRGPKFDGTGLTNWLTNSQNDPGFVDAAHEVYRLQAGSPLINAGSTLAPEALKTGNIPLFEYVNPYTSQSRNKDNVIDIGAFEY